MAELVNTFAENMKYKLIPNTEPYDFLVKFYKGNYKEDDKLLQALEELLRKWNIYEKNITLGSIEVEFQRMEDLSKEMIKELQMIMDKMTESLDAENRIIEDSYQKLYKNNVDNYAMLKSFEQIDQVEINKGKGIPHTNGIDIHPFKNVYVAMGSNDGDLVIRDQGINKEISRVRLTNNFSGATQNCLWSPSGNKIMVSTLMNPSIYIYDETGKSY